MSYSLNDQAANIFVDHQYWSMQAMGNGLIGIDIKVPGTRLDTLIELMALYPSIKVSYAVSPFGSGLPTTAAGALNFWDGNVFSSTIVHTAVTLRNNPTAGDP